MEINKVEMWLFEYMQTITRTAATQAMQSFALIFNVFCVVSGSTVIPLWLIYLALCTRLWFMVVLYIAWIYIDRETGFKGGRKLNFLRNLKLFHYYRDYFPIRLIKTADLPPDKNYLLVMYPHGIIGYSVLANFASNANNFDHLYPGLDTRQVTLNSNFYAPFTREYILSLGGCAASEHSIMHLLTGEPSKAVVLVAGGAAESALTCPGTYRIIINRRKGFVRVALKSGSPIVPVFSFGENDNQYQYKNKWWTNFQEVCRKYTRVVPIIPRPCLPHRTPINTVVGSPILVPKVEHPSEELIDEYHQKFKVELKKLFDTYKGKYDTKNGEKADLMMY